MTFRIRIDRVAQQEIDEFAIHAAEYSEAWATEQFARLSHIFAVDLAEAPLRRSFFVLTGAPYRAYLFRVGRRTHYWISTRSMRLRELSTSCVSGTRAVIRDNSSAPNEGGSHFAKTVNPCPSRIVLASGEPR
jgi:hypothetical protein